MKTASEWVESVESDSLYCDWRYTRLGLSALIKQIQLDAWKQGMAEAAGLVHNEHLEDWGKPSAYRTADDIAYDNAIDDCFRSILSARDNKTSL